MKEFTYREKMDIYEILKDMWRSSDTITYKDLEKVQIKEWGQVAWKWSTLRNKASKEGWNKEKGVNIQKVIQNKRREILREGQVEREEVEILAGDENEYVKILHGIQRKYEEQFEDIRELLEKAINDRDDKTIKFVKSSLEALEMARTFNIKLLGHLDIQEQKRLDIEILKLEILTLKTETLFEPIREEE